MWGKGSASPVCAWVFRASAGTVRPVLHLDSLSSPSSSGFQDHVVAVTFATSVLLGLAGSTPGQKPPAGFDQVDHEIRIGVQPGRLRFAREAFAVAPGSKVKLILENTDAMLHNLVICRTGEKVLARVASAALALGGEASAKHFVPTMPEVLFHTKAIMPGETDTIWFRAPKVEGKYPYICTLPGHTFTMKGVMHVGEVEDELLTRVRYRVFDGSFRRLAEMARLQPVRSGEAAANVIDLADAGALSNYGVWFHGRLNLARAGKYVFFLRSDDGGRIRVDGSTVVDYDGVHGAGKERRGEIELGAGVHELWVEYFQGGGGQVLEVAMQGPGLPRRRLSPVGAAKSRGIPIPVVDRPVVMRVHVQDASSRSVAVGLPGGMNFVFDTRRCCVEFGWAGAYLDVGPDRQGRGGQPCRILGERFEVGGKGFSMRIGGNSVGAAETAVSQFRGYRPAPNPRFEFDWNGRRVNWTVSGVSAGVGLKYRIEIPGVAAGEFVELRFGGEGFDVTCPTGQYAEGRLRVPGPAASAFEVTVKKKEEK